MEGVRLKRLCLILNEDEGSIRVKPWLLYVVTANIVRIKKQQNSVICLAVLMHPTPGPGTSRHTLDYQVAYDADAK